MEKHIITGVIVDEQTIWTSVKICQYLNISEELFREMEEHGLVEAHAPKAKAHEKVFDVKAVWRIEKAVRLHGDLGVNLPGAVLVLELLDELEALQHRLAVFERSIQTLPD